MRLNLKFKFLFVLSIYLTVSSSAQLGGEYIIGAGLGSDFPSIGEAVDSLNLKGVYANVTFKIKTGAYDERVSVNAFPGASAVNHVVFTSESGNREDVTIASDAPDSLNNYLFKFNGCNWVTIKDLSFQTASNILSTHVILTNGSSHNKIEHCKFIASTSILSGVDSTTVINSYYSGEKEEHNEFYRNEIIGGGIGLSLAGEPSHIEEGNLVTENNFSHQKYNAVSIVYQTNFDFSGNDIDYQSNQSSVNMAHLKGRGFIKNNKIYSNGSFGLNASYHDYESFVDSIFVTNNMISVPDGCAFLFFYAKGVKITHNTCYSANTTTETVRFNDLDTCNIENNLFVNNSAYSIIQLTNKGGDVECNFNGFSNSSEIIGLTDDGPANSLLDWQTSPGSPGASSVYDAVFIFRNNEHDLTPYCGMPIVFKTNNYLSDFSNDFNSNVRSETEPWMGAAELRLPEYHTADLEGFVTDGTDTLKDGIVKLYADTSINALFDEIASFEISDSGYYNFNSVIYAHEYWIKIIPEDPDFIVSYHNANLRWDEDLSYKLADSCGADYENILPRKIQPIEVGTYHIEGTVTETGGAGKTLGTDPIPGLDVVLDRIPPSKNTVAVTQTDENGNYYFGNLPEGTYIVTIDYEGLSADTLYKVNLNSDTTEAVDLDYCVDLDDRIRGCVPSAESSEELFQYLKVYPNPTNGILFIEGINGVFELTISDLKGRRVFQDSSANGFYSLNTNNLNSGIYTMVLTQNNFSKSVKIVK